MTESAEQQYLEALKLSVSIALFAIEERYRELANDKTPLHFHRVVDFVAPLSPILFEVKDWETMHRLYWGTYLEASDKTILSLKK